MNTRSPHIIMEGATEYKLGELKGSEIVYDFNKILTYLNAKGKLLFGNSFKIVIDDRDVLFKLCNYFIKDEANCKKMDIDIYKGILLTGPVGCGNVNYLIM